MMIFAEVLLPLPIDHPFTYSVPAKLEDRVQKGGRVLVPFGHRRLTGCIVGFSQQPDPQIKIKEIIDVLDETPALNPSLLELTRWVSHYYFAPWGEVLKTVLPGKILPVARRFLRITEEGQRALREGRVRGEQERAILSLLSARSRMSQDSLWKRLGPSSGKGPSLTVLLEKGWIEWEWSNPPLPGEGEEGRISLRGEGPSSGPVSLTPAQREALDQIVETLERGKFRVFLLQGVTGSGKTELYLRAISAALRQGRQVIFLVPEIVLTPRIIEQLKTRFPERVALLHSGLSSAERLREWHRVRNAKVDIVLGTRSAIFAPFTRLGLIIIDEEHDSSYKQEDIPRYNGRDVAIMRAKLTDSVVILGSATPSLESYFNVQRRNYHLLKLPHRVRGLPLPPVEIVDLRRERPTGSSPSLFSGVLLEAMEQRLMRSEQTLLLLNRRGYAPFIQCIDCGFVFQCLNCDLSLTYHRTDRTLRCHYCGLRLKVSDSCPQCKGVRLLPFGLGTQRVEEELREMFRGARIARLDRDIARRQGNINSILEGLREGKIDILVGTQLIAKGHDYPRITLVGVISADLSLNIPDFRAAERTYQLITQVAGRAGRDNLGGEVIVQTYHPHHYALQAARHHDYEGFCERELEYRHRLGYPPFTRIIVIRIEGPNQEKVQEIAHYWGELLQQARKGMGEQVEILGPTPAIRLKIRNKYRWQILLKSPRSKLLSDLIRSVLVKYDSSACKNPNIRINIDVDPLDLL